MPKYIVVAIRSMRQEFEVTAENRGEAVENYGTGRLVKQDVLEASIVNVKLIA